MILFCLFKQKSEYEMLISDWSSDVCSSDLQFVDRSGMNARMNPFGTGPRRPSEIDRESLILPVAIAHGIAPAGLRLIGLLAHRLRLRARRGGPVRRRANMRRAPGRARRAADAAVIPVGHKIGRAPCRESVCQYV